MAELLQEVRELIAEELCVPIDDVTPETRLVSLGADSLDIADLSIALEVKFGKKMLNHDYRNMFTVRSIVDFVERG